MPGKLIMVKRLTRRLSEKIRTIYYRQRPDRLPTLSERPFYLSNKYRGPLSLEMVDKRGLIDFDLGIFYNRVPKAGNSSVVSNLHAMKHGYFIQSAEESKKVKASFLRPSDLSIQQVDSFDQLFKCTMVRNPYSRILSSYLDKVVTGKKKYRFIEEDRIPNFHEFCLYLKEGGWRDNIHWAPQTAILLLPLTEYDFIGHLESYTLDIDTILKSIKRKTKNLQLKSFVVNATDSDNKLKEYYCKESADIIGSLYLSDFESFGYDVRPYFID